MLAVDMLNALKDMLGLTGSLQSATQDQLYRAINRGKDRLVAADKWPWLETSTTQLFTSGTRLYNLATVVQAIVSIEGSSGIPVRKVERDTYDEMHRRSTAAAGLPSVYVEQGRSAGGRLEIHVWPTPNANSSGTLRYIASVQDTTGSNAWDHIPASHHKAIFTAAQAEVFRVHGLEERARSADAQYQDEVNRLSGRTAAPVLRDGSEQ